MMILHDPPPVKPLPGGLFDDLAAASARRDRAERSHHLAEAAGDYAAASEAEGDYLAAVADIDAIRDGCARMAERLRFAAGIGGTR